MDPATAPSRAFSLAEDLRKRGLPTDRLLVVARCRGTVSRLTTSRMRSTHDIGSADAESLGWIAAIVRSPDPPPSVSPYRAGKEITVTGDRFGLAEGPIIVFDAMCVLCSANAQFILRHDRAGVFRLAAMQSEIGAALYRACGIDPRDPDTLIVVRSDAVLRDSDAVLAIYAGLGWPWRAALLFKLVPIRLRDPLYRWVARNRYRIFGRRERCWVPSPRHAGRIL